MSAENYLIRNGFFRATVFGCFNSFLAATSLFVAEAVHADTQCRYDQYTMADYANKNPQTPDQVKLAISAYSKYKHLPEPDADVGAENISKQVAQGEACVSSGTLITEGIGPCIGVVVVNRNSKRVLLIHADHFSDVSASLETLLPLLGSGPLEAVLAGGNESDFSHDTLYRVLVALESANIKIVGVKANPTGKILDLGVDPASGTFY